MAELRTQPWKYITGRGCTAAAVLGVLFTFITLRLTLGSAGMTPPLTIPAGLLSYAMLHTFTRLFPSTAPFTPQENAVVQTMATSCYKVELLYFVPKIVGFAGYGSYLTALSYPIYLQLGGAPKGQPGYDADAVIEPDLHLVYPYLICIAFGGIFALLGLRILLIVKWRLPYPSGTASGSMINSLHGAHDAALAQLSAAQDPSAGAALQAAAPAHTAGAGVACSPSEAVEHLAEETGDGGLTSNLGPSDVSSSGGSRDLVSSPPQLAARKVKVLAYTTLGSFMFDVFKWLFQGSAPGCGFANWPTFGLAAAKWTWRFDFQQQYIGSGFLVPHVVAWSMLFGAILSWGIIWPLLAAREGDWYPAGLSFSDMRGLAGYKIFLSVALLLGEGAFIMIKAASLGYRHLRTRKRARQQPGLLASRRNSNNDSISSSGSRGSLARQLQEESKRQDVVHTGTSSSSCFLHCSFDAAATPDIRLRTGTSSEFSRHQQQPTHHQQTASRHYHHHHHHRHHHQQQQQQLALLEEGLDVSVDAHAVVPDGPSTSQHGFSQAKHMQEGSWSRDICSNGARSSSSSGLRKRGSAPAAHAVDGDQQAAGGGVAGAVFQETTQERCTREGVFLSDSIPGWLGPAGYCLLAAVGVGCIPLVYPPARWYMVLVAFLLGPPVALANGFGAGITDVDNSANYATVAMFLFAAWSASTGGNGIVAGCVLSGVLMVFSVSAAVLLQDLRTGYMTLTPPSSMLFAQVLGAAFGVLFAPLAFVLFWSTGQVGVADGPYPVPYASVTRGMASIGVLGVGALPRHCALLSGVFFIAAFTISIVRELLPVRYARFVPSPTGMAFPFFIPASTAIDFWIGSVIVMIWEWKSPATAAHYAPLAGAGLLVGDGLWAIPSAVLAIANVLPPMCIKFE